MDVELYKTTDPPNKVTKSLNNKLDITGVRFKDDETLNVVNPTIIINISALENTENDASFLADFNYVRIPKLSRYYYITNMSTIGGLIIVECKSDPLMSFKSDIYGSNQYISRSQKWRNDYIVDNLLPIHSDNRYLIKPFTDPVSDPSCNHVILETIGKGGTIS